MTQLKRYERDSKEYFRWIHCFKHVNKVKRSRMKVSKRKDYVSKTVWRSLFCMSRKITTSLISLQLRS